MPLERSRVAFRSSWRPIPRPRVGDLFFWKPSKFEMFGGGAGVFHGSLSPLVLFLSALCAAKPVLEFRLAFQLSGSACRPACSSELGSCTCGCITRLDRWCYFQFKLGLCIVPSCPLKIRPSLSVVSFLCFRFHIHGHPSITQVALCLPYGELRASVVPRHVTRWHQARAAVACLVIPNHVCPVQKAERRRQAPVMPLLPSISYLRSKNTSRSLRPSSRS